MKSPITLAVLLSLGVTSSISSSVAHALGVGDAQVISALNAPLRASIPLVDTDQYAAGALDVRLAQRSAYEAAGLEWNEIIADMDATLEGQPLSIHLRSPQPVEDPWLDLLLVIETPSGSHAHEITLLFDPVDYQAPSGAAEASVSQPRLPQASQGQASQGQASQEQAPQRADAERRAEAEAEADQPVTAGVNDPAYVRSGDTLWRVAERLKPEQASMPQMMIALLEANPDVFPSGNINTMRAGFTLNVPDDARIMRRSAEASAEAIEAMNAAWRNRAGGLASVALPEPEPATASEETPAVDAPEQQQTGDDDVEQRIDDAAIISADALDPGENSSTLLEQLEESQRLLSQFMAEREQMQEELEGLRRDVSELTEALAARSAPIAPSDTPSVPNASAEARDARIATGRVEDSAVEDSAVEDSAVEDSAVEDSAVEDSAAVGNAAVQDARDGDTTRSAGNETLAEAERAEEGGGVAALAAFMGDYRWTLMSLGLLLLLILLFIVRRRQSKEWEDVDTLPTNEATASTGKQSFTALPDTAKGSASHESQRQASASSLDTTEDETLDTDPFHEPAPTIYAAQEIHAESDTSDSHERDDGAHAEVPEQWITDTQVPDTQVPDTQVPDTQVSDMQVPEEWEADDDEILGRSQAASLATQRSAASRRQAEAPADVEETALSAEPQDAHSPAPVPPEEVSSKQEVQPDARFIDYQPPSLSTEPTSPREETPMQPTVEFEPTDVATPAPPEVLDAPEELATNSAPSVHSQAPKAENEPPLDEGWEIEEVAFKVPGRDNARSS